MRSTGRCCFCKILMYPAGSPEVRADPFCQQTREHMVPQSIGPSRAALNTPVNLRPSCRGCNDMKEGAPWQVWAWFIRQPGVPEMDREARRRSFRTFVYGCALAGFTAAKRDVLRRRPKSAVFTFIQTEPEEDCPVWFKGKTRVRGRFAPRFNGEHQ